MLQDHASADARAQLGPRYGIHVDEALGVSMADMKRVARRVGRDHALAADLWATGVYEARVVAGLVDDPSAVTIEQMDAWCADFDSWAICDTVCFTLFDRAPGRVDPARAVGRRRRAVRAPGVVRAAVEPGAARRRRLGRRASGRTGPRRGARRGRAPAGGQVDLDGAARGGQTQRRPAGGRADDGGRGSATPTVVPADAWAGRRCASSGRGSARLAQAARATPPSPRGVNVPAGRRVLRCGGTCIRWPAPRVLTSSGARGRHAGRGGLHDVECDGYPGSRQERALGHAHLGGPADLPARPEDGVGPGASQGCAGRAAAHVHGTRLLAGTAGGAPSRAAAADRGAQGRHPGGGRRHAPQRSRSTSTGC